jgi:O-antigen/teichoic acid export membrane protein
MIRQVMAATYRIRSRSTSFRRAGWSLADQAVISGANFLTIYLLALHMELSEFGLYTVAFVGLLFLNSIQDALITQPHNVLSAKRDEVAYREFTSILAVIQCVAALAISLLIAGIGILMWLYGFTGYGALIVAVGIAAGPWMFQEFVRRVLYTKSDSFGAFVNDVVSYGLQVAGIVLLIFFAGIPRKELGILILGISSCVAGLLGLWQLRSHVSFSKLSGGGIRSIWTEVFEFGQWLIARKLVDWVGKHGHTWLILVLLGPVMVGVYKAVSHFINVLNIGQKAAQTYLPSRGSRIYAEQGVEGLNAWLPTTQRKVLIPFTVACILLVMFSRPILAVAYGDKFNDLGFAWGLEWIIIIGVAARWVTVANNPVTIALMALRDTRALFWTSILAAVTLATCGVALIYQFGIFGVAFAKLLIAILLYSTTRYLYRRRLQRRSPTIHSPIMTEQPATQSL